MIEEQNLKIIDSLILRSLTRPGVTDRGGSFDGWRLFFSNFDGWRQLLYELILTDVFWMLSWPFTHKISKYFHL